MRNGTMFADLHLFEDSTFFEENRYIYIYMPEKGLVYDTSADKRTIGQGCPFCANRRLLVGFNDLKTRCPEAAEDWDYELNEGGPEDYKYCSNISAHW